jgi:WhiB family transcriptional regulator, redox-sensing transcriptional regulator
MAVRAALGSLWEQAACLTADPELFFPVAGGGAGMAEIARAKVVCGRCPVRSQCLDFAIETGQAHGVWGGTTVDERRAIASRRRRALARQATAPAMSGSG